MTHSDSSILFLDSSWEAFITLLKEKEWSQVFVLVDANTSIHCLPKLESFLEKEQMIYSVLEVEAGEASKELEVCASLWNALTEERADRKSVLINLGGGMITDLGGFVASLYKRGITFLNLPTSLLGMVDASIGGKCGIDFNGYKNQLGAFNAAHKTFIAPSFLVTLPPKELLSGYAEVIKHSLIADVAYWDVLKNTDIGQLPNQEILQRSIEIKSTIVAVDPLEEGDRKKLNFGHTVGHAVESYFMERERPIPHGFAIAAGMICETWLSKSILDLPVVSFHEIVTYIDANFQRLQITLDEYSNLISFMKQDKKNVGSQINCTLLQEIGIAKVDQEVGEKEVLNALKFYFDA